MVNGLGPWWFPDKWRRVLTNLSNQFFDEASWIKHDEGYERGDPARQICDLKFLQAMLRDASKTSRVWKIWACVCLAGFFWTMVRLFGWMSYNYKPE